MRKGTLIGLSLGVGVAVFAGSFGAIQLTRWLEARSLSTVMTRPPATVRQASLETASEADFRATAKKILPSVVSIDTQVQGETWFGERVTRDAGSGSGVVISPDGYIVTNNHVIRASMGFRRRLVDGVTVTFSNGQSAKARIVGSDPRSDLAVLKVEKLGLKPAELGDSSKLEVGEWVLAVGNPLGYENTLSVGVVSSVGRPLPSEGNSLFIDGIQTDAAINQGNSGGALCNSAGQLVGINTAIASIGGGSIGIGFAIPVNRVRQVVDDILKNGYAKYGTLGVKIWRDQSVLSIPEARRQLRELVQAPSDPPERGVLVQTILPNTAAARAGMRDWDVILEINGRTVAGPAEFFAIVSPARPGDQVRVRVWQAGRERTLSFAMDEAPRMD